MGAVEHRDSTAKHSGTTCVTEAAMMMLLPLSVHCSLCTCGSIDWISCVLCVADVARGTTRRVTYK